MDDEPPQNGAERVAAINLKLPPFWPTDPQVWFTQVEAQFTTRGITLQKTKFDYIVASLAPEFATEVRHLILEPLTEHQYNTLKEQLTKRTAASEQRRLQQLFNAQELGDRKPSQLLRHIQQLLGDKASTTDGAFMRELFLQRLPVNVRMVLASTPDTGNLEELAQLPDKIMEVATPAVSSINAVTELEQIRQEVAELKMLMQSIKQHRRSLHRCTPSPAPPRSPGQRQSQDPICWYHAKFVTRFDLLVSRQVWRQCDKM